MALSQLPSEAAGVAAGVLIYSFVCDIANILMVWLVWTHDERLSYVACISYTTLISTTCSIIQQIHDYLFWRDVATAQLEHKTAHVGNPELTVSNGSVGMDLVLFYIQYYCYIVTATFVMFWAFSLTQSIYGWSDRPHLKVTLKRVNIAGKMVSVVLPLITVCLLQAPFVQRSFIGFIIMADIEFFIGCTGGCVFLIMILLKYIETRRQLRTFSVGYGKKSASSSTNPSSTIGRLGKPLRPERQGIYDKWLMLRFTIAFIVILIFVVMNVMFQLIAHGNNKKDALAREPDLSADRAKETIILNLSGVTASLLVFVTFGTTRPFREHMRAVFVPACLRRGSGGGLPYHHNGTHDETVAQRRHTSMLIAKGVDTDVCLTDLGTTATATATATAGRRDRGPASPASDDDDFAISMQGGRPPHSRF